MMDGAEIQHRINLPQQMVRLLLALSVKPIKKPRRLLLPPRHRTISYLLKTGSRESLIQGCRTENFFNGIA
jgi:hypothetical protein